MRQKIVIIGGGIGGLSAGIYARMSGFETEIHEMHSLPGGLCTAWKRNGFTFDGCIHWLMGLAPETSLNRLWNEIGALGSQTMHFHDAFYSYEDTDKRTFHLYCDADRLERHMNELSPVDRDMNAHFCGLIRNLSRMDFDMSKPADMMGLMDFMKMMKDMKPMMKDMMYCTKTSIAEYADRFQDPLIRRALRNTIGAESSLTGLIFTMASLHKKDSGFPLGGSLLFAQNIEKRYRALGGKIVYNSPVDRILVEKNKARGILLKNGTRISADYVISAADLATTRDHMLEGRYDHPVFRRLFAQVPVYPSSIQISLGIEGKLDLDTDSVGMGYLLKEKLEIAGGLTDELHVKDYSFDPSLSPEGRSYVMGMVMTDAAYWQALSTDRASYEKEKERVRETWIGALESVIPGIRKRIVTVDVATPLTYIRYTGNWKGAYMTWMNRPDNAGWIRSIPRTFKGLKNFYLASMWVMAPGGLPGALMSGRYAVQHICRAEKVKFMNK